MSDLSLLSRAPCRNRAGKAKLCPLARLPRKALDGSFHHVTGRGTGGVALFVDDEDRAAFVAMLRHSIERFGWRCHAWCLLGTHYHLILETPLERLSRGMHRLNGVYATRYNERYRRRGRLYENRFASFVLRDEEHLSAACEYVLQNPVKAGLCADAADWRWSGLGRPR